MCIHWFGSTTREQSCHFGSLAVVAPLLERMGIADIIDRHLPADPQAEYAYGPLLTLLLAARLAYYLLQRLYRQQVEEDAPPSEKRTTTETILRAFQSYTLWLEHHPCGRVVHTCVLTVRQRQILQRLNFPTPAQFLSRKLPHLPP